VDEVLRIRLGRGTDPLVMAIHSGQIRSSVSDTIQAFQGLQGILGGRTEPAFGILDEKHERVPPRISPPSGSGALNFEALPPSIPEEVELRITHFLVKAFGE